jgi:predicted amidohydrolase YtcJ
MGKHLITGAKVFRHGFQIEDAFDEILLENDKISAYGRGTDLSSSSLRDVNITKLPGGIILPGFFDAHIHLEQGGRYLDSVRLRELEDTSEVLLALKQSLEIDKDWIVGIGLHENAWPSLSDFNSLTKTRPIIVFTRDYHSAIVNSKAIDILGLTDNTVPPNGGWFEKNSDGSISGVLRENAIMWAWNLIIDESLAVVKENIKRASEYLINHGITGVSDAGGPDSFPILQEMDKNKELKIRVEQWVHCASLNHQLLETERCFSENLNLFRFKLFIDGALGSRTAWMFEPFKDQPDTSLNAVSDLKLYDSIIKNGIEKEWTFVIHAIGDAGVDYVIELLDRLPTFGYSHRIEHIQHVAEKTIPKLRNSSSFRSIQPLHRLSDIGMLHESLEERRVGLTFPQKSLLGKNRKLVFGTDWPVVSANPMKTIHAAIEKRKVGEGMPGEELSIEEAVFAYTQASAEAAGFKNVGSTEEGSFADLVWINDNPGRNPEKWINTVVQKVWRNGVLVVDK